MGESLPEIANAVVLPSNLVVGEKTLGNLRQGLESFASVFANEAVESLLQFPPALLFRCLGFGASQNVPRSASQK